MIRKILTFLFLITTLLFAQSETESSDFSYPLKLYNQKFYDLAAQQFVKFYTNYPNSIKADQAHYFAAMSYFELKEYQKARVEFQSLAVGFPKSDKAAEAWLKTGLCSELLSENEDAAKSYETIRLLYPKNSFAPEGLYRAGVLYISLNNFTKAFQTLGIVIEQYTGSNYYIPAMVKSALSLYYQDEIEKADQLIQKVLNSQQDSPYLAEAYLISAKIKMEQGYSEKAKLDLQKIITNYKKSDLKKEAVLVLSQLFISEKAYKSAEDVLQSEIDKNDNQGNMILGDIYFLQNKSSNANTAYKKVSLEKNSKASLLLELKKAVTLRYLGQKDAARNGIEKALINFEHKDKNLFNAADSVLLAWYQNDGLYEESVERLNQRLTQTNNLEIQAETKVKLAELLSKEEKWRDVIHLLEPLTLIQQSFSGKDKLFFLLAQAQENLQNYNESIYYYNKLLSDFPGSVHFNYTQNRIEFLESYKTINQQIFLEKLADITAGIINGNSKKELQYKQGLAYLEDLKQFDKAEEQLKAALLDSSNLKGELHLQLGKTYLAFAETGQKTSTNTKKAIEQFKYALQNSSSLKSEDEAAWQLIKITLNSDTISLAKEKTYLETLINKYPESQYKQLWFQNLAYRLSYDSLYLKQSLKYFKVLIDDFKESKYYSDYLYGAAQLYSNTADNGKALDYYKLVASEYPYTNSAPASLFEVANDYESKGKFVEAEQLYKQLIQRYYYSSYAEEAGLKLGAVMVRAGKFDEAIKYFGSALNNPFIDDEVLSREFLSVNYLDKVYFYAYAQQAQKNTSEAVKAYKKYIKKAANGTYLDNARFQLGTIYFDSGRKESAADQFRAVRKIYPELYNRAQLYLAQIYFDMGDYDKAALAYNELESVVFSPEQKEEISALYVVSLIRAGKITESKTAISRFKKAYPKQKNNSARFIIELADYQRLNKNFNSASKLLREVKSKYKKSDYVDDADYTLALINVTLNKNDEAFKILSNFYNNYPQSNRMAAALNTLGSLYFRTEKYDNAIAIFKNALKANPDRDLEANIKSNLIKTYTLTGFWDAAQALAREYVQKFKERDDLLDKKIIIAQSYINLNQFQNAVDYLKKMKLEADSEREPEIQFYIGEALLKGGQYENAIAEFVKIPLLSKKTKLQWEASALYYSGQSYEKLGRTTDAIRMYQEIIDRPGIDLILKKEAEKRIQQIQ